MIQHPKRAGFTIIELMLAMAFVAMLLLAIAIISVRIMGTYSKGLTIREVNQVGRTISEDMQRTIGSATPFSVEPKTGSSSDPGDSKYVVKPGGGRLCAGGQTYAWNYGKTRELADPGDTGREPAYNLYTDGKAIRFVKVNDPGARLCNDMTARIDRDQARELLATGDYDSASNQVTAGERNLAVQRLNVVAGARDGVSGQALYAIEFVIGTNDQDQLDASSSTCLPSSQGEGSENFCAINQFNIIARAGNRSESL